MRALTLWHADGEGRCHLACEQARPDLAACAIMERLPWTRAAVFNPGMPCPFAVLADVLLTDRPRHDEKPDDPDGDLTPEGINNWLTGYEADGVSVGEVKIIHGLRVWLGILDEKSPKPEDEDHRCGTCAWDKESPCRFTQVLADGKIGHFIPGTDGPPWPNCRFWMRR